jgi:hypothetical protein
MRPVLVSKPAEKLRIFGSPQITLCRVLPRLLLCGTIAVGSSALLSRPAMCQTTQSKPDQATPSKQDQNAQTAHPKHRKKPKPQVAAVELPPPQPAVAPNLLEQPALPATVTANDKKLSVKADNSSLSQILHQVSSATGMKLDGLGSDERVFGVFGPGEPREVLTALLNGTSYNVMMVGDLPSGAPRELLLSRRGAGGAPAPAPNANANANQNQSQPDQDNPDDSASPDDSDDSAPPMQYTPPSITPAEPPPNTPSEGSPSNTPSEGPPSNTPSEAPPRPMPQMQNAPE